MLRFVWPLAGVLFFCCVFPPLRAEEDYTVLFGAKYAAAEEFLRQYSWISASLRLPPQETQIALAVVFPEIIRFKSLEDKIQVRALKVLYVQYGRKYADFSVGHFQMKPTFAEQIERDYNRLFSAEEKTAAGIAPFDTGDSSPLRKERVVRLDDLQWQARYLRLFMMVMGKLYQSRAFADDLEKLRFYATAYTAGYAKGERTIRKIIPRRHFHVHLLFPKTRYSYADIAVFYFIRQTAPAARVPCSAGDGSSSRLKMTNCRGQTHFLRSLPENEEIRPRRAQESVRGAIVNYSYSTTETLSIIGRLQPSDNIPSVTHDFAKNKTKEAKCSRWHIRLRKTISLSSIRWKRRRPSN
jgi:hypothetical protein